MLRFYEADAGYCHEGQGTPNLSDVMNDLTVRTLKYWLKKAEQLSHCQLPLLMKWSPSINSRSNVSRPRSQDKYRSPLRPRSTHHWLPARPRQLAALHQPLCL